MKRWWPFQPKQSAQPVQLERGAVYAIQAVRPMTVEDFTDLSQYLEKFREQTGCEFLVLDANFRLVKRSEGAVE